MNEYTPRSLRENCHPVYLEGNNSVKYFYFTLSSFVNMTKKPGFGKNPVFLLTILGQQLTKNRGVHNPVLGLAIIGQSILLESSFEIMYPEFFVPDFQ